MLRELGEPAALLGYCLGGTMAIAAANLAPVERVVTLAAPWISRIIPRRRASALATCGATRKPPRERSARCRWKCSRRPSGRSIPQRTVKKFADFGKLDPASAEARRFVELEDWANEGEPLPYPAARELIEDFFGARPARRRASGTVGGKPITDRLAVPLLNSPPRTTASPLPPARPPATIVEIPSGHVGMVVGSARAQLHDALAAFLEPACR